MEKFALILTGGTIGSVVKTDGICVAEDTELTLLEKYHKRGGTAYFDVFHAQNLLSENFSPAVLCAICNRIFEVANRGYRGIIVATGTDNLGYFSVYLGFVLRTLNIPIAIISSQFVLDDLRENGTDNLCAALVVLNTLNVGIYTVNKNLNAPNAEVHLAVRLYQPACFSGDVKSENGVVGWVIKNKFVANNTVYLPFLQFLMDNLHAEGHADTFVPESRNQKADDFLLKPKFNLTEKTVSETSIQKTDDFLLKPKFNLIEKTVRETSFQKTEDLGCAGFEKPKNKGGLSAVYGALNPNIFVLEPSPLAPPIAPQNVPAAVLLKLYHSGTIAVEGACSVLPLVEKWRAQQVPIYAVSSRNARATPYCTENILAASGVRILYGMTPLSCAVKLALLYAEEMSAAEVTQKLSKNWCGEWCSI